MNPFESVMKRMLGDIDPEVLKKMNTLPLPFTVGKLTLYEDYVTFKAKECKYADIQHVEFENFGNSIGLNRLQNIKVAETAILRLTYQGGTIEYASIPLPVFSNAKSVDIARSLRRAYRHITEKTYHQIMNCYIQQVEENGFFTYDGTQFNVDGTVVLRNGGKINMRGYKISNYGSFFQFVPNEQGMLNKALGAIANFPVNSWIYKDLKHGKHTIRTTIDKGVFYSLMKMKYNIEFGPYIQPY